MSSFVKFSFYFCISSLLLQVVCSDGVCDNIGLTCDEKCNIVLCTSVDDDPIPVTDCSPTHKYCEYSDNNKYECTADICNNPNSPHRTTCTDTGVIPSPYKCDVGFICTDVNAPPYMKCTCEAGQVYDIQKGICVTEECPRINLLCRVPFESGEWTDGYSYVCNSDLDVILYRTDGRKNSVPEDRSWVCEPYIDPKPQN